MIYSVVFTKKFTCGLLEGLTSSPQFLGFPNLESRARWIRGIRRNQTSGSINWEFEGDVLFYKDATQEEALEDYRTWAH